MRKIILLLFTLGIFYGNSKAQIITDRPDQTESSSTVSKGSLQIESGILVGYEESTPLSTRQLLLPTNLFRYGITNGLELRVLSQLETLKNGDINIQGISDLEIGAKIQIFKNESSKSEVAFLTHLIVPTGTDDLSNMNYGTINKLSISHELSEDVGLGYNIGYDYFGDGNGNLTYSVAIGSSVNEKIGVYIEPYGELANMEEFIQNFDAGFTYLFTENIQFDFSFGAGINHRMNYISIGCSWLMNKE